MLKLIIASSSNPGDLVLDSFAGSGTTLAAAESLNRKWIGIDNSPSAIDVIRKRMSAESSFNFFMFKKADYELLD